MNINKFTFKYLIYYPVTFFRGELPYFILKELNKTQYLEKEMLKNLQLKKLNSILRHAKETTNHYNCIKKLPFSKLSEIDSLKVISKEEIRNNYTDFTSTKFCGLKSKKTSGGSTGAPVTILKNNFGMANELAATWRGYSWAGIDIGDKQGRFWGVPFDTKSKIKSKLIDTITNRFRLSAFSFSKTELENYVKELTAFKPKYFYGYVSMIKEFAIFVSEKGLANNFNLSCIITTSEVLTEEDKKYISNVFSCPVFNEYGCGEIGTIAHECEKGNLHISSENVIIEILDDSGAIVPNGVVGEIVVSDLTNYSMPLIRYRMKDFGAILDTPCACGRTLPIISKIQGRAYDIISNTAGKKFHGEFFLYMIEDIKRTGLNIDGYQVIQNSLEKLTINIICDDDDFSKIKNLLAERIAVSFDRNVSIEFNLVETIPRERSGKLRVIKGLQQ